MPRPRRNAAALALVPLLLAACGRHSEPAWSGYAEGDYVYVAAPVAGTLESLDVVAGQQVTRGRRLFALSPEPEQAASAEAQARLAAAAAQAANTGKGRRPPEVEMQQAELAQARAQAVLAQRELARRVPLEDSGAVSRSEVDAARATLRQAQERVTELEAAVQVARLPSRSDEQAAASAQTEAARQVLQQSEWRLQQKQQAAPADGVVSDTFFRAGEYVAAGQPVLALLPAGQVKARFYVAEAELARIALGQAVQLSCDGCGEAIPARVSFISTQPEYTPPVIYSNAQRQKLVFLVEARPQAAGAARLHPGQPLDVRPAAVRAQ